MEELFKKLFAPKPTSNMSGFQFSDLLNNDRWRTAQRDSYSPKRGELAVKDDPFSGVDYRQYVPRKNVTEKVTTGDDGKTTSVVTTAYEEPGDIYGPYPLKDRQFRPDDGMGANSFYSPPSLPYERLADINKSRFTPGRFMPSTFAEEGPAMASYAPPTMRGIYDEEGPALGYRGPVMTSGNPFGYPQHATIKGPPRYTDVHQEMPGAQYSMRYTTDEEGPGQRSIPQSYGPAGQIAHRMQPSGYRRPVRQTSATTYPYNMVPQAEVGLLPITTQSTPQPRRVPLSFSNQSQLNRFPEGISPVEGMTDAMKRRMLELFLSGDGSKVMRSD